MWFYLNLGKLYKNEEKNQVLIFEIPILRKKYYPSNNTRSWGPWKKLIPSGLIPLEIWYSSLQFQNCYHVNLHQCPFYKWLPRILHFQPLRQVALLVTNRLIHIHFGLCTGFRFLRNHQKWILCMISLELNIQINFIMVLNFSKRVSNTAIFRLRSNSVPVSVSFATAKSEFFARFP